MLEHAEAEIGAVASDRPCTEKEIERALACPCLDDLKTGPCAAQVVDSFKCFLRNKHVEPGTTCYPVFQRFHECLQNNAKHFEDSFVSR
jgi:mitochondrial intermembrane space import and assembly protein 40